MVKNFFIDTNVMIDAPDAINVLQSEDNNQIYIPWTVIQELDKLKTTTKVRHKVYEAIKILENANENIHILEPAKSNINDTFIQDDILLEEIILSNIENPILISNDILLRIKAKNKKICAEPYKDLIPFAAESQKYTGIITKNSVADLIENCFYWNTEKGDLIFFNKNKEKVINYNNTPWEIKAKTKYQNAAMELMLTDNIDVISIQSSAGFGKTYCALACALELVFKQKLFNKIYIIKPTVDVGAKELGFLPGTVDSKIDPYFRNIHDLLLKLHDKRPVNKAFKKDSTEDEKLSIECLNKKYIEYLPINFLRGANIENAVCILDEFQQYTRDEARTILSRFGENCKVFITGDVQQIDNVYVNEENNALNWVVKLFKNNKNYAHIVLKGQTSRGPICDLVRKTGL